VVFQGDLVGDRVLLAHRPGAPFFAVVAGFLEAGETLEECAAREVLEETGVSVDTVRYFGSQPWPFPHQIMVAFFARYAGGEIAVDGRELDEAKFFRRDELPPLPPPLSIARRMIDAWYEGRMPVSS
jgi:NAD+ diphosphatase